MKEAGWLWIVIPAALLTLAGCGTPEKPSAPPEVVEIRIGDEPPPANSPVNRPKIHVVKSGETLGQIAFSYGLDYTDLALWNSLSNPNLIEVGQRLKLSPPSKLAKITLVQKTSRQKPTATGQEAGNIASGPARVTRTQVRVEKGGTAISTGLVSKPHALKIDYSKEAYEQLLSQATGGAQEASLRVSDGSVDAALPSNVRNFNGINWSWPARGRVLQSYSNSNPGIDIGGPRGQPIYAAADGKVIYAGSGLQGFGQLVIIKHAGEYLSTYAHNDLIIVAEGEQVKRGSKIAEMGDSGAQRIAVHFGIRRGEETYNPTKFLPKTP